MCTALTSRPANAMNVPTISAMLESPSTGGTRSRAPSYGIWFGLPSISQANMKKIRNAARQDRARGSARCCRCPADDFIPSVTIEGREPEHDQHHRAHVEAVGREIGTTERRGQRRRAERQQRRDTASRCS